MDREVVPEEGEVSSFERVIARLMHNFERAKADPSVLDRRARDERAAWLDALRTRCETRGVPRGADLRHWVFADALSGQASTDLGAALARRGDPRDARWAVVVLLGGTGVGKSAALARVVARHPRDALYQLARDAALALADRTRSWRGANDLYDQLREVDLLALDELGTESPGDSLELLHLISARCDAGRVTLCAGNLPPHQFALRYLDPDARFASRLAGPQGTLVEIDGLDLRAAPVTQGEP